MIFVENCIVGAGPGGIQLGYFFHRDKASYCILEQSDHAGSFFSSYPLTGKLISINKKYTGNTNKDFNLRHDWNSLLGDESDLNFTNFSNDYYPNSEDLVRYLNYFSRNLNIQYNTKVTEIVKDHDYFVIKTTIKTYKAKNCIIATGLSKPILPSINFINCGSDIPHYKDFSPRYFENPENCQKYINKKVLIIGKGNAAFEIANCLNDYCSSIFVYGPRQKLSIASHYSGHLRSVYLKFFDSFYLKSLNAINHLNKENFSKLSIEKINDTYFFRRQQAGFNLFSCDYVINCTGWQFDASIFKFDLTYRKYPATNYKFHSVDQKNLFFIGTLMHFHDQEKSSGGFIHGFRYLIKYFYQCNFSKFVFNQFPLDKIDDLAHFIHHRVSTTSSLYQMYGILMDVITTDDSFNYIQDVTLPYCHNNMNSDFVTISMNYGSPEYDLRVLGVAQDRFNPKFLHIEFDYYTKKNNDFYFLITKIKLEEDNFADFSHQVYFEKIKGALLCFFGNEIK